MAARPTESPATASGPLPAKSFRHGSPGCGPYGARGYTKTPGNLLRVARKDGDRNVSETWGILQKMLVFHETIMIGFRDAMWAWIKSPADVFF